MVIWNRNHGSYEIYSFDIKDIYTKIVLWDESRKKKHHLINLTCAIYGTYVFLVDYGTYEIFFLLADRRI